MIRITNVGAGHERYYLDQVALGTEPPGWWLGRLCAELGVEGAVREEAFRRVLDCRRPDDGLRLRPQPTRVRARDLTFTQPKSVSVLWALAPPAVAGAIEEANTAALSSACGYVEEHGLWLNDGSTGSGMAAAVFAHHTSRASDPHLHTHVVMANLTRSPDGHRAIGALSLSPVVRTAGFLYQAQLRHEITIRLGLEWGEVRYGVAQLGAVPGPLRAVFSRRREQVERTMAEHHGSSVRSARLAALVDRPEREVAKREEDLRVEWRARAEQAGFDPHAVTGPDAPEQWQRQNGPPVDFPTVPMNVGRLRPPDVGQTRTLGDLGFDDVSSFSRAEVLEALSARASQGAAISELKREAGRLLSSGEARPFTGSAPLRRRDVARTPSGPVVVSRRDGRWRSQRAIEAEERLAHWAREGRSASVATVPPPGVTPEDRETARALGSLLQSGRGVELLEAGPGWRRDAVVAGACRAWTDAGVRVMLAGEGRAGEELAAATGLAAHSPGRLLDGVGRLRSGGPGVVVLAGAESIPAGALADWAEATSRLGTKLVLVGEPGPLPEIDRAGGWRAARAAVGALRLGRDAPGQELDRWAEPALPAASWLVLGPGPESVRQRLVADWLDAPDGAAMVSARRAVVDDLNRRARAGLLEQGRLGGRSELPGLVDARQGEAVVVGRAAAAARSVGLVPGTTLRLQGAHLVSDSGVRWSVGRVPAEADLRYAYARSPYQAWRAKSSPLLVLGPPPPGPRPDDSVYYTVGPSRSRAAERARVAASYERPLPRERARDRSLGRG